MKKSTVVTLEVKEGVKKDFTVNELTVEEILQIVNESALSGANASKDNGVGERTQTDTPKTQDRQMVSSGEEQEMLFKDLVELSIGLTTDVKKMMSICCDFSISDLKPLAPSEIRQLVDTFSEVNSDFLEFLKTLGLKEVMLEMREATLSSFSRMLATSLRAAM